MLGDIAHLVVDGRLLFQLSDLALDLFHLLVERFAVDALEVAVEGRDAFVQLFARPIDLPCDLGENDALHEHHRDPGASHLVHGSLVDLHERIERLGLAMLFGCKQLVIAHLLGRGDHLIELFPPVAIDGAVRMVAEEDQSAALVLVMMKPKVIYGIVVHASDGGDLGEYVLAHQGVPDAEILIDIAAVRHAFHGAGKGGERVDPVTELIGWKGPDIPIADTRLEIEMLLAHFASSKKEGRPDTPKMLPTSPINENGPSRTGRAAI